MKTVHQVSELSGVSVRTLHYYHEIGLLEPTTVTDAGYRLYDEAALARLQRILFFRELDFPLKEIARMLADPSFDQDLAYRQQKEMLLLKRQRLDRLLELLTEIQEGGTKVDLQAFDDQKLKDYAKEARERWGVTEAWQQYQAKAKDYTDGDWQAANQGLLAQFAGFAALLGQDPSSPAAQAQVKVLQDHISTHYYPCCKEILAGLGELYAADDRFRQTIDQFGDGTAAFTNEAIQYYCR